MNFWSALPYLRAGAAVRRKVWATSSSLIGGRIVFLAGAGTTRAVAVWRRNGVDAVVTPLTVTADDLRADDWEVAP
jgi:hypothetical protein